MTNNLTRNTLVLFSVVFFAMFVYSGFDKIFLFNKKVEGLKQKINFPLPLLNLGMFLVILLELFAPIIITARIFMGNSSPKFLSLLSDIMFYLLILFLIVVTILYHPPGAKKMIPFLSNCSTLSGIVFLFILSKTQM